MVIVGFYDEHKAIEDLSVEQKKEVATLQEKLRGLKRGDLVEKDEGIFQVVGPDTTNSISVQNRILLRDNQGKKVSIHLTNPYSAVENWRQVKRILRVGEPGWKETNTWFHYGTAQWD